MQTKETGLCAREEGKGEAEQGRAGVREENFMVPVTGGAAANVGSEVQRRKRTNWSSSRSFRFSCTTISDPALWLRPCAARFGLHTHLQARGSLGSARIFSLLLSTYHLPKNIVSCNLTFKDQTTLLLVRVVLWKYDQGVKYKSSLDTMVQ